MHDPNPQRLSVFSAQNHLSFKDIKFYLLKFTSEGTKDLIYFCIFKFIVNFVEQNTIPEMECISI